VPLEKAHDYVFGYSIVYDVFYLLVPGFSIFREQDHAASVVVFSLVVLAAHEIAWLLDRRESPPERDESRLLWLARGHLGIAAVAFLVMVFPPSSRVMVRISGMCE
jgi:hypothetical protein